MMSVSGDSGGGQWQSVAALVEEFECYLTVRRNVRSSTRACYSRHSRTFLLGLSGPDGLVDLSVLDAVGVRDHVSQLLAPFGARSRKLMATSFRGFLRFAWLEGYSASDLTGAVGSVASSRGSGSLLGSLTQLEVGLLLGATDSATLAGSRDYAVLVVLSRLGLRACEVAGLRLDDLDWESGVLTVRGKGGGMRRLPIPHDVGEAVVGYLQLRPDCCSRDLFLGLHSENTPMTSWAVSHVVARAARRAGLGTVHAHRLRHSAARAVLETGGSMAEVGELLGHRSSEVTRIYASFDLDALRRLARPWPLPSGGSDA